MNSMKQKLKVIFTVLGNPAHTNDHWFKITLWLAKTLDREQTSHTRESLYVLKSFILRLCFSTHSVNTELSQHRCELSELIWQQVLFPHDLQSKRPQNEVKQKRLHVLNSQLSRLYASVLGSVWIGKLLHNASQCLTLYDIPFLECNLTPANCFIMIRS